MAESNIIQIMPASNWFAMYGDKKVGDSPLVGWALIEEADGDGIFRFVTGLDQADGTVERCDEIGNFLGYVLKSKESK